MRHPTKPACRHKCRFIQITNELWLCPHAAWGASTDLKGAIEEGRKLLERAGGYDLVLRRVVAAEEAKRKAREEERERKHQRQRESLKYV
jgi:hypothetical protein